MLGWVLCWLWCRLHRWTSGWALPETCVSICVYAACVCVRVCVACVRVCCFCRGERGRVQHPDQIVSHCIAQRGCALACSSRFAHYCNSSPSSLSAPLTCFCLCLLACLLALLARSHLTTVTHPLSPTLRAPPCWPCILRRSLRYHRASYLDTFAFSHTPPWLRTWNVARNIDTLSKILLHLIPFFHTPSSARSLLCFDAAAPSLPYTSAPSRPHRLSSLVYTTLVSFRSHTSLQRNTR